ncbi:unnamed protein product [Albugo candida]|nr:unnamed protein product [Albugo candida]|eukprot:CCI44097.1 unnamed protein product [Albugo candida]
MIALILIKSNGQLQVLGKQSQSGPSKSLVLPREQAKSNSFREKRRRTEEKKANTAPEVAAMDQIQKGFAQMSVDSPNAYAEGSQSTISVDDYDNQTSSEDDSISQPNPSQNFKRVHEAKVKKSGKKKSA